MDDQEGEADASVDRRLITTYRQTPLLYVYSHDRRCCPLVPPFIPPGHTSTSMEVCCLQFRDPSYRTHHDGRNNQVIKRILWHEQEVLYVFKTIKDWLHAEYTGHQAFILGFYCNHGRHRSVAMSEIVSNIFQHESTASCMRLGGVEHISLTRHRERHCNCYGCNHEGFDNEMIVKIMELWGAGLKNTSASRRLLV